MKLKNLLWIMIILIVLPLAIATITNTLNAPADNYKTTSSSVLFNWTSSTDGLVTTFPTELYVTDVNNESLYVLNKTILYCTNNTACTQTVSGFPTGYFQWIVQTGEDATQPTIVGSNSEPFNTTSNNIINLTYSVNGTTESCSVTLTEDSQLNASEVYSNFTQASASCNLTVTNTTFLTLTGSGYGAGESINITGGSASSILGLTGIDYGTQTDSNSTARYIQVQDSTPGSNDSTTRWLNDSGFLAMSLGKDTGNLWIAGLFNMTAGNLSIGDKITFTLGQIIDATVAGVIRFTTSIRVDGNIALNETGTAYNVTGISCIKWDNGAEDCGI